MRKMLVAVVLVAAAASLIACGGAMKMVMGTGAKKPAVTEFGLGPRRSASGHYVAVLQPSQQLRPRQMYTVRVRLQDSNGHAINDAQLSIDGGMPQHGHGLPTRPRVTRNLGDGVYEIEGVRFNMGGWWEFKVIVAGPQGGDVITFNLDL